MVDSKDTMTIEELAVYLDISRSALYKLAEEGNIPGQKVGKYWRFSKNKIDLWRTAKRKIKI